MDSSTLTVPGQPAPPEQVWLAQLAPKCHRCPVGDLGLPNSGSSHRGPCPLCPMTRYVISSLELLVAEDYMIVYLNGATPRRRMPGIGWLKKCYQMIDRRGVGCWGPGCRKHHTGPGVPGAGAGLEGGVVGSSGCRHKAPQTRRLEQTSFPPCSRRCKSEISTCCQGWLLRRPCGRFCSRPAFPTSGGRWQSLVFLGLQMCPPISAFMVTGLSAHVHDCAQTSLFIRTPLLLD